MDPNKERNLAKKQTEFLARIRTYVVLLNEAEATMEGFDRTLIQNGVTIEFLLKKDRVEFTVRFIKTWAIRHNVATD